MPKSGDDDEALIEVFTLGIVAQDEADWLRQVATYFAEYALYEKVGCNTDGEVVEPYASSLGLVREVAKVATALRNQYKLTWRTIGRTGRARIAAARGCGADKEEREELTRRLHLHTLYPISADSAIIDFHDQVVSALGQLNRTVCSGDPLAASAALDNQVIGSLVDGLAILLANEAHHFTTLARPERTADAPIRIPGDDYYLPMMGAAVQLSSTVKWVISQLEELRHTILRLRILGGQAIDPEDEDWLVGLQSLAWPQPAADRYDVARLVALNHY